MLRITASLVPRLTLMLTVTIGFARIRVRVIRTLLLSWEMALLASLGFLYLTKAHDCTVRVRVTVRVMVTVRCVYI